MMLTYEECKKFAKATGIKKSEEWKDFIQTFEKDIPKCIPKYPQQWFARDGHRLSWVGFEEAKEIIKPYKFKLSSDFHKVYEKEKFKEKGIPKQPDQLYKNSGWKSWQDFLNSDYVSAIMKSEMAIPYEELKKLVRENGIKTQREYIEWVKKQKRDDIVASPHQTYSRRGDWVSYPELFGVLKNQKGRYESFDIIKQKVKKLNIKSKRHFEELKKHDKLPIDIPRNPEDVFRKQWKGYGDFFGTNEQKRKNGYGLDGTKFWSYNKARKWVINKGINTWQEYKKLYKKGEIPPQIPRSPRDSYVGKGWKGIPHFFNNGRELVNAYREFRSFSEARRWARKSGFKTMRQWRKSNGIIPDDIPKNPHSVYKKEWKGYNDFLGIENGKWRSKSFKWLKYEEAKKIVQKKNFKTIDEFKKWASQNNMKMKIPVNADKIYGGK